MVNLDVISLAYLNSADYISLQIYIIRKCDSLALISKYIMLLCGRIISHFVACSFCDNDHIDKFRFVNEKIIISFLCNQRKEKAFC